MKKVFENIVYYFDPSNEKHIDDWKYYCFNGCWPSTSKFSTCDFLLPVNWADLIERKITNYQEGSLINNIQTQNEIVDVIKKRLDELLTVFEEGYSNSVKMKEKPTWEDIVIKGDVNMLTDPLKNIISKTINYCHEYYSK
jgi:hypothetical protein